VIGKHWLSVTLVAAATAALPAVRTPAQDPPAPGELSGQELDALRATLVDPGRPARERDEAAKRLLERGAYEPLRDALRGSRADVQASVARALAESKNPPPGLLDPLLLCLAPRTTPELADAASLAIANYRNVPAARARLRDFVMSANAGERQQIAAIHALGTLNDKDTAGFLVDSLMNNPQVSPELGNAAADALGEMTGLTEYGRDVGQWTRWWRDQQGKSNEQFLAERRAEREGSARQAAERLKTVTDALNNYVRSAHNRITNPKDREADTLATLNNAAPEFRAAGARLANEDLLAGIPPGQAVKERLRDLIGDSSSEVRRESAVALASINDPLAVSAILTQLRRERIEPVRAALIKALGPTKDVTPVPVLLTMLNDPAFQVSEAAAQTLGDLGSEIAKNPVLTKQVANALADAINRTAITRGADRFRALVTGAMVPLKDRGLVTTLFSLLDEKAGNTPAVRGAAVRALAQMNAPGDLQQDIAGRIRPGLQDSDKNVRLETARALGIVGGPAQAQALFAASGAGERDEAVRDAAWKSLSSLFDQFEITTLAIWANQNFANAPDRQLVALLALNKKLVPKGGPMEGDLAAVRQQIGTLYLSPGIDKPDEALPYLQSALTYHDVRGGVAAEKLQEDILTAYIHAKKYKDGVQFANGRIRKNQQNAETMGRVILKEATFLEGTKELQAAADLLTEAINSEIGGSYHERFVELDRNIRGRILPYLDVLRERWLGTIV
jgi:HEAT repeat protein